MFSVTTEDRQYQTYILSDHVAESALEVVPERGGIATRWQLQGYELFYMDHERFKDPSLTVRGGMPILFPICGNLPGDTYTYKENAYTLKQHGFARNLSWQVMGKATDQAAELTLTLASTEQTLAAYPFAFHLEFTYQLQGTTLTLRQRYTNHASEPMPFSAGFHPYFTAPNKASLQVSIPGTMAYDQVAKETLTFTGGFDFEQPEIDWAFRPITARSASVYDDERHLTLKLSYDEPFRTLVFWTVKGKDFYCLEPWTAPRNAIISGEDLLHLPPGETLETTITLTASFNDF